MNGREGNDRLSELRMRLAAYLTLVGGRFEEDRSVEVAEGRVTEIASFPQLPPSEAGSPDLVHLSGKALLPGTVNTHCHTFQSLLRGLGDDLDFMVGASAYDAVRILAKGIELGGTDAKAICAALTGLTNYPGITGRITKFNKGEVTKPVQIQVIKDGKVRSLATIDNPEVITPPVE